MFIEHFSLVHVSLEHIEIWTHDGDQNITSVADKAIGRWGLVCGEVGL